MTIQFKDTKLERDGDDLVLKGVGYYSDYELLRLTIDEMESMGHCKLSEMGDVEGILEDFDEEVEKLVREHARRVY